MVSQLPASDFRKAWLTYHECRQNAAKAADKLGLPVSTFKKRLRTGIERHGPDIARPHVGGKVKEKNTLKLPLPKKGQLKHYILTSVQNNTHVNEAVWENLLALKDYFDADLLISGFVYNKGSYSALGAKKGTWLETDEQDTWFDPIFKPFMTDERLEIANHLVWCGEMQVLPTAARPLSGFEDYTGRKSIVIPHPQLSMQPLASAKSDAAKLCYTTGCVTERNYIQKKAGLKADRVHNYGGLMVTVHPDGSWYVTQLSAGANSEIYYHDMLAEDGEITTGHRVKALTPGDIHAELLEPEQENLLFGPGGMVEVLNPEELHVHDALNFARRSHHTRKSAFELYSHFVSGNDKVDDELDLTANFFHRIHRDGIAIIVIDSNHDRHFAKWLETAVDWRNDFTNILTFLHYNKVYYTALKAREKNFNVFAYAMKERGVTFAKFLAIDDKHPICPDADDAIECSLHGDIGPNGTRPSPQAFVKMGQRLNIAHSHSPGIYRGVYIAGVSANLDQGYNKGPSSWAHSHIITYANGTRAITTCWKGRWR